MPDRPGTGAPTLRGAAVLVTRPAHQAAGLVRAIEEAGGRAVCWPALTIEPPRDTAARTQFPDQVRASQIVIFISSNAVEQALAQLPPIAWPRGLLLGAVGEGTARALRDGFQRGPDLVPPERFDSEGLLALPTLQAVAGKRILIVRGEGGRELLADSLRARGAAVEYAEVYRRACPGQVPAEARAALVQDQIDIVTATSAEALRNLLEMAGELADPLRALPLVVVSERMAREAKELGFRRPAIVARAAGSEALVEALRAWAGEREQA